MACYSLLNMLEKKKSCHLIWFFLVYIDIFASYIFILLSVHGLCLHWSAQLFWGDGYWAGEVAQQNVPSISVFYCQLSI